MIDPELLEILVCPEAKTPVRLADQALIDKINLAIAEGRLTTRGGKAADEALDGGLVREDGALLYPIRDGIPVMLIDEAIPLTGFD
ncbi:MAG: Trm112 family protein [Gemmatimonadota bacterium]